MNAGQHEAAAPPTLSPRRELWTAILLSACLGVVMFDRSCQFFLGPYLVRDMHLSAGQIGVLAGAVSLAWAASTFVFGGLSDRVGRMRVLIPAMVAFSLLSWVSGLTRNFHELLLARALLGLAEGPCWSVIMALMEELSSPRRKGRNLGLVVGGGVLIGGAVAPVVVTLLAELLGWRGAFFAAGVPGLVLAGLVVALVREPASLAARAKPELGEIAALLRNGRLWLCFVGAISFTVSAIGVGAFAPLYMTQNLHFSGPSSGLVLGAAGLGGFVCAVAWPALSDKFGRRPALILAVLLSLIFPLALLFAPGDVGLFIGVALLTSAGPAIGALMLVVIPVELAPPRLAASAVGFVSVGAEALGATGGPVIGGLLAERYGLSAPLALAVLASLFILVVALALGETRKPVMAGDDDEAGAVPEPVA